MSTLKTRILPILYAVKLSISKAKLWLWIRLGFIRAIMIQPYKGFGNRKEIYFVGRVLQDKGIGLSNLEDRSWQNVRKMLKRFMSTVIPGVQVKAEFMGIEQLAVTDDEGYFEFRLYPDQPMDRSSRWQEIKLTLVDRVIKNQGEVTATSRVFVPKGLIEYGIVSDIDDTIVSTGAIRLWEMLKTTFTRNAHTRVPFPGVSAFYSAMEKGTDGLESNPFFYVSSSPWNLYDFLMEFLDVHGIPKGPLMLRDLGLSREQFIAGSHSEHKLKQIQKILRIFDEPSFILIGDSGQKDPEIYLQVVKDYPGRIQMIYIRKVDTGRDKEVDGIMAEIRALGVEALVVEDTMEAAHHAIGKGWIREEDVLEIAEVKQKDEEENQEQEMKTLLK